MQDSSITLQVYFRTVWKLLLERLHHSDDIHAKTYVRTLLLSTFRIILGHPIGVFFATKSKTSGYNYVGIKGYKRGEVGLVQENWNKRRGEVILVRNSE